MNTRSRLSAIAIAFALSFAAGTSAAYAGDSTLSIPVERRAVSADEITTLKVSVDLPLGRSATISTPSGETIGNIFPYGGPGRRTYSIPVPDGLIRRPLPSIIVRTEGERAKTLGAAAVLLVPQN